MTKNNNVLDFIVVGAAKTGTTSLYEWMKSHPDLYIPEGKEVPYFSEAEYSKGMGWYIDQYFQAAENKQKIGSITPQYMNGVKKNNPEVICKRIAKDCPDGRFVAILRHPIERTYSHYKMLVRRGHETRSFDDAVEDLLKRTSLEKSRKYSDMTTIYIAASEYGRMLGYYYDNFKKNQIKVYYSDELRSSPRKVLQDLFKFIGVDSKYVPPNVDTEYHKGGSKPKSKLLTPKVLNKIPIVSTIFYKFVPHSLRRKIQININFWNIKPDKEELNKNSAVYKQLVKHFAPDINKLEELTGTKAPWTDWK